jgi:hypothetical protein
MRERFPGLHESFERDDEVEAPSARSFGFVLAGVFALLSGMDAIHGSARWPWLLVAALLLGVVAMARPSLLSPLSEASTRLARVLNALLGPVVLAVVFYLCVTPVGFFMRLVGNDPLRLRRDPDAATYWVRRKPPGPLPGSLKNQY